ncbi:MAG: hypothetical protein M3295_00205 [Chloroflexota bacterium]|nr:hypothetical protein [Chloroflexota bacterium]
MPTIVAVPVLIAGALLILHGTFSTVGAGLWIVQELTREPVIRPLELPQPVVPNTLLLGVVGLGLALGELLLGLRVVSGSRSAWLIGVALGGLPALLSVLPQTGLAPDVVASLPPWRWLFILPFAYVGVALLAALLVERWLLLVYDS